MRSLFEGTGVALVTPFYKNKIDYKSLKNLLEKTITEGTEAIILLGTTGEAVNVSFAERKNLIKFCKQHINNRAKLIVGTGNNNMKTCLKNTLLAKNLEVDGVLVVTPYYNKTTQQGLIEYYNKIAQFKVPIIVYNVPSRTGLNIELSTFQHLISTNPYIYGIKESTTDINRIIELSKICDNKVALYSGEDHLNYVFYTLGANGCISVTANAYPKEVSLVYRLAKHLEYQKAKEQQHKLDLINHSLFCETNPVPIKHLLHKLNIIKSNQVRPPLVNLSKPNEDVVNALINYEP